MKWKFIKHVRYNELSYLAIHICGIFTRITIRSTHMSQMYGVFEIEKNELEKECYIQRMVDVGEEVKEEEYKEIEKFYIEKIENFMGGNIPTKEINELIKKYNKYNKIPDIDVDINGNYEINF